MPQQRRASRALRRAIDILTEPRQETAAEAQQDVIRDAIAVGHGDAGMRSMMTRGYWTEAGWWPISWWDVSSGGLLQV